MDLPLQLLRLQPEHEVAILEMGMSHAGEIAALCKIAAPDWGVVTNVGTAHAENFSDGQAGIARAKYELIASLPRLGTAILNSDDKYVQQFGRDFAGRTIYFGTGKLADPRAESITPMGVEGTRFNVCAAGHSGEVKLHLMGEHNVRNALAGIAVGLASGISLEECAAALEQLTPPDKRGQTLEIRGATLINDSYNSNPQALRAMVDTLLTLPAKRTIVVAGEMLELGPAGPRLHRECGELMGKHGINVVVGVRGEAASIVEGAKVRRRGSDLCSHAGRSGRVAAGKFAYRRCCVVEGLARRAAGARAGSVAAGRTKFRSLLGSGRHPSMQVQPVL